MGRRTPRVRWNMAKKERRYRRRKRNILFLPVAFVLVCLALVLGLSVFFKVSVIEVEGNSLYTDEEVIEASGIQMGDNLLFVNRFSVDGRILSRLPYVDRVISVDRSLPNRVTITIQESTAMAVLDVDGTDWILDQNCKVLGEAEQTQGYIEIRGITAQTPAVGATVTGELEEGQKLQLLSQLLTEIRDRNMQQDITWLDLSNIANPIFDYMGRFTVWMGTEDGLSYKFDKLLSTVAQLEEGDVGTIDLSIDEKVHFRYE